MKILLFTLLALGTLVAAALAGGETCFKSSDETTGNLKICYYHCPSGEAAITVKSYQLCPLRITR